MTEKRRPVTKKIVGKDKSGKKPDKLARDEFAEESLRRAEAKLAEAQRIFHLGSWDWYLPTGKLEFSDEMFRIIGMVPGSREITPEIFNGFLHPEEVERVLAAFQQSAIQPFTSIEHRIVLPNGDIRYVQTRIKAYKDAEGRPLRLLGSTQDITDQKIIEDALKESENKFSMLFNKASLPAALSRFPDHVYVDVNDAWVELFGYTKDEVVGKTFAQLGVHRDTERRNRTIHEIQTRNLIRDREQLLYSKSGDALTVLANINVITIDGQDYALTTVQNITERKRAEIERGVLLEIMQGLALTNELQAFYELIHHSISKVIPAKNLFIVLLNQQSGLFEEVYTVDEFDEPLPPSKFDKTITSYVCRTGEPLLLDSRGLDNLLAKGDVELVGTRPVCWLGVPLKTKSGMIGVIAIQDYGNPNCYSDRDKDFLSFIGTQIALGVERKYAQEKLVKAEKSLREANFELQQMLEREKILSRTDSLTDAHNRRYFFEIAEHEFIVAKRYDTPLSMIMFDVDHFKGFNDSYGHQAGDVILKRAVQIAKEQLRTADVLARYGGEEFIILLSNSRAQETAIVAERIRSSIAAYQMNIKGDGVNITISVGVAECTPFVNTLDQLIQQADSAMYAAKAAGRNCVEIYSA
jgi:diguanylate cyclase (GGDEF)-like protein/PAS domain S-box-containing protein